MDEVVKPGERGGELVTTRIGRRQMTVVRRSGTSELCMNTDHQTLYRGKTETLAPPPSLNVENHTIRRGYRRCQDENYYSVS